MMFLTNMDDYLLIRPIKMNDKFTVKPSRMSENLSHEVVMICFFHEKFSLFRLSVFEVTNFEIFIIKTNDPDLANSIFSLYGPLFLNRSIYPIIFLMELLTNHCC